MVNKPKKRGTAAETRVVRYLEAAGLQARRVVQKGKRDEGDIHIIGGHGCVSCILEVKGGRQTQSINRKLREDWLKETRIEAMNTGSVRGFLVIAKHGSSVKDYHVWDEIGHRFWYLDEFVRHVEGGF
jgi:Holliday junction resolvase-like predicted endonuclease